MATHDYVIDNSTGANVRADINNVLQAILTNNSRSSAPSTTAAYMFWADTTSGTLKIRNSSDNAWVELLQLDGTLTLEDGSASTPALAFRDDLDTGIFSAAADTFNVATGGVERMELGATTIFNESGADVDFRIEGDSEANLFYVDAGNNHIGINDSTPSVTLDITGENSGNGEINVKRTSGATCFIQAQSATSVFGSSSNHAVQFKSNGTTAVTIDTSQRMLLGTTTARSPQGISAKLQVEGTDANSSSLSLTRNSANQHSPNLIFNKTRGSSVGSDTVVQDDDALGLITWTANDGSDSDNVAARISALIDGTPGSNDTPGRLVFSTTADGASTPTERVRISNNGNVGIGTTNPGQRLEIRQTSASHAILAINRANSDTGALFLGNDSSHNGLIATNGTDVVFGVDSAGTFSEKARINSSGNVGIGVSPTARLHVYKAAHYVVTDSGKATHGIHVRGNNGNAGEYGGAISFSCGDGDSSAAIAARQGGSDADFTGMSFFTHPSGTGSDDAVEKVRIHHSGEASFNDGICLGNGLTLSSSNTMEDYEEGTFTLAASAMGVTNSNCKYVKVGRLVHCTGTLDNGSSGNGALVAQYSGLPFSGQTGLEDGKQGGTIQDHNVGQTIFTALVSSANMRIHNDTGSFVTQSVVDDKQINFNIQYYTT